MTDCYRYLFPDGREYTWARKDKNRSRLDRFYIPQELVPSLQSLSHHPFMSDHSYVRLEIRLPEITTRRRVKKNFDSGFWKLNTTVLEEEDFLPEFQIMWDRVQASKASFPDIAEWWDQYAKEECRALCVRYSAMTARLRRDTKDMLMVMLTTAITDKDWVHVAVIRGRLKDIMNKDNLGFSVRSRIKENLEWRGKGLLCIILIGRRRKPTRSLCLNC